MYKELDQLRYELLDGLGDKNKTFERTFRESEGRLIRYMFDYLDFDFEGRRNDERTKNAVNFIYFIAKGMKEAAEEERAEKPVRINGDVCCRSCHERIYMTDRYCAYCGTKIRW